MYYKTADEIRRRFEALNSKGALIDLINYTRESFYPKRYDKIPLRSLTYYADHRKCTNRYREFIIKKKNGGDRVINTPVKELKEIQRALNAILSCIYTPYYAVYGFVPNRSIVDAAKEHVGMKYLFCSDLKDFFPSITLYRIKACLMMSPFSLNKEREPLAYLIANLCCDVKGGKPVLPQGAPTSPILSNIVCGNLDRRLTGLAKRFRLKYTRYADDLSFSGMENIFQKEGEFRKELTKIVEGQGFVLNEEKTRLQKRAYRQEVCGLVVNRKVNVKKRYVKEIRRYLHFWEILGKKKTKDIFVKDFCKDKPHRDKNIPSLENFLNGKLLFLKMVKGDKNEQYLKLRERFLSLSMPELSTQMKVLSDIEFQLNNLLREESTNENEVKKISRKFREIWQSLEKNKMNSTPQLKQVRRIEEKLLKLRMQTDEPVVYRKEGKKHHPAQLVDLLFDYFSQKDGALKFSVHKWDKGRHGSSFMVYDDFINILQKEWNEIEDVFSLLNERLAKLFSNFLTVKNHQGKVLPHENKQYEWGNEHVPFGWRSKELQDWCRINPNKEPSDYELEKPFTTSYGEKCQAFANVINIFRREFQFRSDIQNFTKFFLQEAEILRAKNFTVCRRYIEEAKVYTNVQAFRNAVSYVFSGIINYRKLSDKVNISSVKKSSRETELERDYLEVTILHVGSITDKKSNELWLARHSGDFNTIHKNLWNVCDWIVEAKCTDGNFRFNYLTSYSGVKDYEKVEDPGGFKHIFRFYLPSKNE